MTDLLTLRCLDANNFAELANWCGLPVDTKILMRLDQEGLLPTADFNGGPGYFTIHLGLLRLYGLIVSEWHHPWTDPTPAEEQEEAFADLRKRFRPFGAWSGGGPFDMDWWRQLEQTLRTHHPLGEARHLSQLLAPSVIATINGDARLSIEVDRFFAELWALIETRTRNFLAPPSPHTLMSLFNRSELDLRHEDVDVLKTQPVKVPGEKATGKYKAIRLEDFISPLNDARAQARQAAQEHSVLISLTDDEDGGPDNDQRLQQFYACEAELSGHDLWEDLAQHYRHSMDLFDSDEDVAKLLIKLADLYLHWLDRPEEATELYLRAVTRVPADRVSIEILDPLLREQERWEELAAVWQRAASQSDPSWAAEAWTRVSEILMDHLGDVAEAINALRFAIAADPDDEGAREALSKLAEGNYALESEDIEAKRSPSEWLPLANIAARWAERIEDPTEAADWYERASELHLRGDRKIEKAFDYLRLALSRDPERISALGRLESLAARNDRWDLFAEVIEELLDDDTQKGSISLLSRLAEAFLDELGSDERAAAIYLRLLEIDPTHEVAKAFLAEHSSERLLPPADNGEGGERV